MGKKYYDTGLPKEHVTELERISERDGRSVNSLIRKAIELFINEYKDKSLNTNA